MIPPEKSHFAGLCQGTIGILVLLLNVEHVRGPFELSRQFICENILDPQHWIVVLHSGRGWNAKDRSRLTCALLRLLLRLSRQMLLLQRLGCRRLLNGQREFLDNRLHHFHLDVCLVENDRIITVLAR